MKPSIKKRIDLLLCEKGLTETRAKAQALIMAGVVYVGTERVKKSSEVFDAEAKISVKEKPHDFVGRGGLKLKAALDHFKIDVKNKVCLDVGASTGGFTDCLLKNDAKKVYAVDAGSNQLDWKLRNDARVVVLERVNFRHFDTKILKDSVDIITMDVSFISATKLISKIVEVFGVEAGSPRPGDGKRAGGETPPLQFILLIKPQFEVGREHVGKGGIVKDEKKHEEVVGQITKNLEENGFKTLGVIPSPILGQDGNKEFLGVFHFLRKV